MKIALVEDNGLHQAQIRQEIQNYFAELNEVCELRVFDNGSDMLDHYYSVGGYDLLLLDIQLPGMDGVSAPDPCIFVNLIIVGVIMIIFSR